ncbi:sigma 54 modulation/S30EA ribosomal C-terminal domain-containing protein [Mycobacterium haemophilum]|uniref:Sigma 54 modulation/S30EA ribosomal protein C-terminal domain-containing protein n=1 Tax=Mycobacterium haemophilum TaxID=29311 RepID=A0A0I9TI82_9MYCO|nr:sigma 54 modulation/S30EA ribosomal C-terminal domain-containing protein [Mycobacterium haemophilum]KLO29559.1 hypothetical protein ABH39_12385 [Mycobacterium haemophilum]KLO36009.1 hypothetical protein ABH38_14225 [Mycobacterium haemophilum]KLO41570.1 hypothetical protein ABH37_13525 [Mycobacterium haemophilum]KLO49448.1 hypothetical protein ABH36_12785 [Mycobacterium haemophilum]
MPRPWRLRPWPDRSRQLWIAAGAVIVRRKACVLQRVTPLHAVAVMDATDYDVHLFADAQTGQGAVVYRVGRQPRVDHTHQTITPAKPTDLIGEVGRAAPSTHP